MEMMSARVWGTQAALRAVDASMDSTAQAASHEPAVLATEPPWHPPAEFDDYRIVRPLGQGAMGDVYLAHDLVLDRPVAVKFIGHLDQGARERFLVEARAAARIHHPNVMAMFRIGEQGGHPYLVSEYIRGKSLAELALPIPWTEALGLAVGLARGLAAAHRHGVLHRDIKTANAVLDEEGVVKLLDFSLAKLIDAPVGVDAGDGRAAQVTSLETTTAGTLLGTPNYMAPELWRAEPATRSSDVYALGVLIYMLCWGRPPIEANTAVELAELVQSLGPPSLLDRVPGIDPQFVAVVERCLRHAADERYASGEELRVALEAIVPQAHAAAARRGNPYRGLRAFEAEHRDVFFGRTSEIQTVVDRLRDHPLVVVTGDSGVGKSSLCRAGVVPAILGGALDVGIARKWRSAAFTPGRQPVQAVVAALARCLQRSPAGVAAALEEDTAQFARDLRRELGPGRGIVLLVDQLEELVTLAGPLEAARAARLIARLAADIPGVRVVATARGDFLTRIAQLPGLQDGLPRALYFLLPLSTAGVREAVVGPAHAQGVRFESEELVDRLVTAGVEGSLPLLQFALAELWEARDAGSVTITAAALERIGGVSGALARHADSVIARLTAGQRRAARLVLMRLVTVDDTRASLPADELVTGEESQAALDALVAARLLVIRDVDDGTVHEIAHEALIRGWLTLQIWLDEDREARGIRHRLEAAAAEWDRLHRPPEVLWHERQLAEAALVDASALRPRELAFLAASRTRVRRRRTGRRLAVLAAPVLVVLIVFGVRLAQHLELGRRIADHHAAATVAREAARARGVEVAARRAEAFAAFDARDRAGGEAAWQHAVDAAPEAARLLDEAARELESAVSLDPARADLRAEFAAVLHDRALLAEQAHDVDAAAALIARAALHDVDGQQLARWLAPAQLTIDSTPPGARVTLQTFEATPTGGRSLVDERDLGPTPIAAMELPAGSYLLTFTGEGLADVRVPLLLRRGEVHTAAPALPAATSVPDGFVHVPAGRFLFGAAADEDLRKGFLGAVPMHEVSTDAYLIARHETTYADWIAYLEATPPEQRADRLPGRHAVGIQKAPTLARRGDGTWELRYLRNDRELASGVTDAFVYPTRDRNQTQDWTRFPVSGIDWADADGYLRWLDASGRVPGARFCSEVEWERAARGADGRSFPHGDRLSPADANIDETYGRDFAAMGPDMVGTFPASRSPFGLDDAVGNVFEWTASAFSSDEKIARGGGFFFAALTGSSVNRAAFSADFSDGSLGLRVCATPFAGR